MMRTSHLVARSSARILRAQVQGVQARACAAAASSGQPTSTLTYGNQGLLPPLPVPSLEETCDVYLGTCKPLLDDHQLAATSKAVESFKSGVGKELQQRLLARAAECNAMGKSWLEDWWLQAAYLSFRMANPANSNYSLLFDKKDTTKDTLRAAKYIRSTVDFKANLESEKVAPEYLRRTTPQCMEQFSTIFTSCRVPWEQCDKLRQFVPSRHAIIICKKQIFKVDVIHPSGEPYTVEQLEKEIQKVKAYAHAHAGGQPAVAAMTAANRDLWTEVRNELFALNERTFEAIEKALLAVTLDGDAPQDESEAAAHICAGSENTAPNRWYDKTVQFIVFENGYGGLNGEHSPLDAPIVGRMLDYVLEQSEHNTVPGSNPPEDIPPFEPLQWNIPPSTRAKIDANELEQHKVMRNLKMRTLRFKEYGADWIKKAVRASPDAYAQMGMQLAYFKLYGRGTATYETGTARAFLRGRTDTVRTFSTPSKEWTKAMEDKAVPREEKRSLLMAAIKNHSAYMRRATDGKAVDRHLLGLKLCLKPGEPVPDIYTDPANRQSSRYRISTSNMPGQRYLSGFGPTEPDGYGFCYTTRNDSLHFTISSFNHVEETDCEKMRSALVASLCEMRSLFDEQARL